MPTTGFEQADVTLQEQTPQKSTPPSRPASTNGYALSTAQLHQLLTGDQQDTCNDPFDKAVRKQQQLMVICNLLDHQNSIHRDLDNLLYGDKGANWLDQCISEFKSGCPSELLLSLMHMTGNNNHAIEHVDTIQKNYFSLVSEVLYTPLLTLTRLQASQLSDQERHSWYQWCLEFGRQLKAVKNQINKAGQFFSDTNYEKLSSMTDDTDTQQQLNRVKKLFYPAV